uniref:Uncharacterized protein n=2 Tax=unclassified bacterial viruses TaxID=12333 RepID=A0AAU6VYZ8_9VIRU
MIELIAVISMKVFFTCLVAFVLMLLGSSGFKSKDDIPDWLAYTAVLNVFVGAVAFVVFLLIVIWM